MKINVTLDEAKDIIYSKIARIEKGSQVIGETVKNGKWLETAKNLEALSSICIEAKELLEEMTKEIKESNKK